MSDSGTEFWFYHLEQATLEGVLPMLLEKTRGRGWRAIVHTADTQSLGDLDAHLWTYRPDSALAHGRATDAHPERQPILLSASGENLNGAQALFIVDQTEIGQTEGYERCFIIFDGRDDQALAHGRGRWKALKDRGARLAYWKQSEGGGWVQAG